MTIIKTKNEARHTYDGPVVEATFLSRKNRFIAEVLIKGKIEVVHVKNTGRLSELFVKGATCYLQKSDNPNRKTRYDLISIRNHDQMVNVDSQVPNDVVYQAFLQNKIQGWENPTSVQREVTVGNSRLDFKVEKGGMGLFVEVKGVNLVLDKGHAAFPDAITSRGTKHLMKLLDLKKNGYEAMVLFLVQRLDVVDFRANYEMDPLFSETLSKVSSEGVQVRAYKCEVGFDYIAFGERIPVL